MSTCLSQLYHEEKRGKLAAYAKLELFPIWNLKVNNMVNASYEAATVDIDDKVIMDNFHMEKYSQMSSSYNRDLELYPILDNILTKIYKKRVYFSPTDMGVNYAGFCITDEEIVKNASINEIIRRYLKEENHIYKARLKKILDKNSINIKDHKLIKEVLDTALKNENVKSICGIEDEDKIIIGKEKEQIDSISACILNYLKKETKISDEKYLIDEKYINKVKSIKKEMFGNEEPLNISDVFTILSTLSEDKEIQNKILSNIKKLKGKRLHYYGKMTLENMAYLKKMNIDFTTSEKEV